LSQGGGGAEAYKFALINIVIMSKRERY